MLLNSIIYSLSPVYRWKMRRRFKKLAGTSLVDLRRSNTKLVEPEFLFVKHLLASINRPVCFDIGANFGYYTYLFTLISVPENIFVFEPIPGLQQHLEKCFPGLPIRKMALSDHDGREKLMIPEINGKVFNTRASLEQITEEQQTGLSEIEVEVRSLDSFLLDKELERIDFIKIDVEGHEQKVVQGALSTIKKFRPILQVEIEERHHKSGIESIFEDLIAPGNESFFLDPHTFRLMPVSSREASETQHGKKLKSLDYINNFYFIPMEKASILQSKGLMG